MTSTSGRLKTLCTLPPPTTHRGPIQSPWLGG